MVILLRRPIALFINHFLILISFFGVQKYIDIQKYVHIKIIQLVALIHTKR